jgi:uncharacterized protein YdhG (YjbR/CyaY superfamily)
MNRMPATVDEYLASVQGERRATPEKLRKTIRSYFPFSGSTLMTLSAHLKEYRGTKGALHFEADKPLPLSLVRKLLRTRIAEGHS